MNGATPCFGAAQTRQSANTIDKGTKDTHSHLAEKRSIGPLVEWKGLLGGVDANGTLVVLIIKTDDDNLGNLPLVSHKSIQGDLNGTVGAVCAQHFNRFFNADHSSGVQEALENSNGCSTDVERVGVGDCIRVHGDLENAAAI